MITIRRHYFPIQRVIDLDLPKGAKIVGVGIDRNNAYIFSLEDTEPSEKEVRLLRLISNTQEIAPEARYIGSIEVEAYDRHLFEIT